MKVSLKQRVTNAFKALRGFSLYDEEALSAFGANNGAASRLLDWVTQSASPDDDLRTNMRRVRARARDLAQSSPYVSNFLTMLAVNVIGPSGFTLNAQVRSARGDLLKTANDTIEDAWYRWSCGPVTTDGRMNLTMASHLLVQSMARDGEVFVRLWQDGPGSPTFNDGGFAIELIDADLVDEEFNVRAAPGQNEVRMGVEVNSFNRPIAYHVWTELPQAITPGVQRERRRIPAEEMIHLFLPKRLHQTRGRSMFYPVMTQVKMLDGYVEAELVAARTGAAKMGFIKTAEGQFVPPPIGGNKDTQLRMKASPGTVDILPPGMDFVPWDPDHPSGAFPVFVKAMLRGIATGLGVSYNALANDLEGVNYSSIRSGLLIERDVWRALQEWWTFAFLRIVFERWLNVALLRGDLQVGSRDFRRYRDVIWTARGWAWVDPLKDVQAAVIAIQNGLSSRNTELAEQGKDFEHIVEQLKDEEEAAATAGVSISGPPPTPGQAPPDGTDGETTPQNGNGNGNGGRLAVYMGGKR